MRRFLILVGPIVAASFAFACEDDPLNNPGTNFPEAGAFDSTRPPTDSSTPLPDAAPDGGDSALPPQPVSVVVANRKGPRQGIVVVFHDATGAVLETKTTDATGRATSNAAGPIPAMATALLGKDIGLSRHILTWTGVEAGDELIAEDPEAYDPLGKFAVTLPGSLTDDAGTVATSFTARIGNCEGYGDPTAPIDLFVSNQCTGPQNAPIVTAYDQGGTPLGFAFKKNVAPPIDAGTVNVDPLTGWTAMNTFTVTVQNPPGVAPLNANLLEIASSVATSNGTAYIFDGNNQAKFKVAPGYADAYQASVRYFDTGKTRRLATRFASAATSATFDFQQALPEITDVTVDAADRKRPSLSWTSASSLAGTDGGYLRATVSFENEDRTKWTIVVPPGATSGTVKAPSLPGAESALFLPDPDASSPNWSLPEAVFAEADSLADYKAFRKFQGLVNEADGTPAGFLPANGSVRTTSKESFQQF